MVSDGKTRYCWRHTYQEMMNVKMMHLATNSSIFAVMKVKRKSYSLTHKDKFLVDSAVNTSASSENLDTSSQREGMIFGFPYLCRSHLLTLMGEWDTPEQIESHFVPQDDHT